MAIYVILALDVLNGISSLFLLCLGLAIIFGMMKIINLAHGEFIMLGAYATVISANAGVNIWIAMLIVAPLFVGIVGLVIERCLIRFLYGRLVDSMLATWGLSLLIIGIITTIYGNTQQGVPTPLGGFSIGSYQSSYYTLFLALMAAVMMAIIYGVMRYTRFGLVARATMQNPAMAATLGVNPARVYMSTFAILSGTLSAASLFGSVNQIGAYFTTPVYGEVIVFTTAIVLIRLLPQGISGRFFKGNL